MRRALESVRRRWTSVGERREGKALRRVRPLAAGFWMLAAAGAAAAAIWLTTAWLLDVADEAKAGTDRARVRVDAVRTGLAAGGGAAAAVGLMLAFRRQRHQELATALNERDAAERRQDAVERRITELYNAAAEHLGSDKAPVRLTALYTLERLANDNPEHRQTIVSIICAYLRMPFALPPDQDNQPDSREGQRAAVRRFHTARAAARAGTWPAAPAPAAAEPDPHAERQVRLTAQRLLHTHLQPDASVHWPGIDLDLTGASLIDFSLRDCTPDIADFRQATFVGDANFADTTFAVTADFREATFVGDADFPRSTFSVFANFGKTTFSRYAYFPESTFSGPTDFSESTFSGPADFEKTTFALYASFFEVTFSGDTNFEETAFAETSFWRATFTADTDLREATFAGKVDLRKATFASDVCFGESTFAGEVELENTMVANAAANHILPAGWRIEPAGNGGGRIVAGPIPGGESRVGPSS
ncbi:pentapeptide repeat-containing protein [Actinomadura sp. 6N118]|uniref:pentapeptide repeat-containing protein n=1 Tax=Actinomadura sp. 6N118 TaxID=3375151 RepID=UPI0037B06613